MRTLCPVRPYYIITSTIEIAPRAYHVFHCVLPDLINTTPRAPRSTSFLVSTYVKLCIQQDPGTLLFLLLLTNTSAAYA